MFLIIGTLISIWLVNRAGDVYRVLTKKRSIPFIQSEKPINDGSIVSNINYQEIEDSKILELKKLIEIEKLRNDLSALKLASEDNSIQTASARLATSSIKYELEVKHLKKESQLQIVDFQIELEQKKKILSELRANSLLDVSSVNSELNPEPEGFTQYENADDLIDDLIDESNVLSTSTEDDNHKHHEIFDRDIVPFLDSDKRSNKVKNVKNDTQWLASSSEEDLMERREALRVIAEIPGEHLTHINGIIEAIDLELSSRLFGSLKKSA